MHDQGRVEDHRIGTDFAGYRIEAVIGRGGMSVVYRAEELALGRKVALKLLVPELAQHERFRERFVRESQIAASIDHPNITPVYEAGEAEGVLFIAMRYVEGIDLRTALDRAGFLDPARAASVITQVAAALDAAAEAGLVHRDVKPGNVLLVPASGSEPAEHVYLSDFGVTKRIASQSLTATGQLVGTIDYVAPEQIEGRPVDSRADVYSLACVAYECLTGAPPFSAESEVAVLFAHVKETPPQPSKARPGLPAEVDRVIARGMAKDPDHRYATCLDLADDLRSCLLPSSGSVAGRRTSPTRRLLPKIVVGVVSALIVAGAGWVAARTIGSDPNNPPLVRVSLNVPADAMGRFDPSENRLAGSALVDERPTQIALGEGYVWVANFGSETISQIDPKTNRPIATIPTRGKPTGIAVGYGSLWVVNSFDGSVTRIDPDTANPTGLVDLPVGTIDVAIGEGGVWVINDIERTLVRIDPATDRVTDRLDLPGSPNDIAVGEEAVWISDSLRGTITRVDPAAVSVAETIGLNNRPTAITVTEGAVWVASSPHDTIVKIDPNQNILAATIRLAGGPSAMAVGEGSLWVASSKSGRLTEVDPATHKVVGIIDVGKSPSAVAVGQGDVWFTIHDF